MAEAVNNAQPICVWCSTLVEPRLVGEHEAEVYDGRLFHKECAAKYRARERAAKWERRRR